MKAKSTLLLSALLFATIFSSAQKTTATTQYWKGKPVYKNVDIMPSFNGDLTSYLMKHVSYAPSLPADFEGTILFKFIIDADGRPQQIKVVKGGDGAAFEAYLIKMIASMPKWKAGEYHGKKVPVAFSLPMCIKLD